MAIQFDPVNKRIILDSTYVTTNQFYSRWKEWVQTSDNAKWPQALSVIRGDPLGGGLYVSSYFFLMNGWRIRPMESNHTLIIEGNIAVYGGGVPVVNTLGNFNVSTQYTVPVQAQALETTGGGGSTDINAIVAAIVQALSPQLDKIDDINITNGNVHADVKAVVAKPLKVFNGIAWE